MYYYLKVDYSTTRKYVKLIRATNNNGGRQMAAKKKVDCEGYELAYDAEDEDCMECGAAVECKKGTEGDEVEEAPVKKAPAKKSAPAKKGAAKKGAAKKAPAKKDPIDDDNEPVEVELTLEERVEQLEARLAEFMDGGAAPAKKKKAKTSKAERDAARNEITSKGPYKKADLDDIAARDVKRYAAGLGINSFGKSKDDVVAECLKAQKTAAGKKAITAAGEAVEESDE